MTDIRSTLTQRGIARVAEFCHLNKLESPAITVLPRDQWRVRACAFYRWHPVPRIYLCPALCAVPGYGGRAWSWPGYVVDRTPYGVICHELGHHMDALLGTPQERAAYGSLHSLEVMTQTDEPGITSYANTNHWEWWAEAFRLFLTNPALLRLLRPRTYVAMAAVYKPLPHRNWRATLGKAAPPRYAAAVQNRLPVRL